MQFQADVIQASVQRPVCIETTALGAACLAGLAVGYWSEKNEIISNCEISKIFEPQINISRRDDLISKWHKAVDRSLKWI
jgi:glycerol kinase